MSRIVPASIICPLRSSPLEVDLFLPRPQIERGPFRRCVRHHACRDHTGMAAECVSTSKQKRRAAFFDVDGTITKTNVVEAYCFHRVHEIPVALRPLWLPWVAVSCLALLLVDHIDRTTFNRLFYWAAFRNRSVQHKNTMARTIYQNYYRPRLLSGAKEKIRLLKKQGYDIVLVTGSLDFLIEPLACELGADFIYATTLVEKGGVFMGQLKGAGASSSGKARCVQEYAAARKLCLSSSLAFGDSIADLSMLEMVGMPCAVNPDSKLASIAKFKGWPIIYWNLDHRRTFLDDFSSSILSTLSSFKTVYNDFSERDRFPIYETLC